MTKAELVAPLDAARRGACIRRRTMAKTGPPGRDPGYGVIGSACGIRRGGLRLDRLGPGVPRTREADDVDHHRLYERNRKRQRGSWGPAYPVSRDER